MSGRLLEGKNAIITGARGGIGKAIVEEFAVQGANIWAVQRNETSEWIEYIKEVALKNGVKIQSVDVDITDYDSVLKEIHKIKKQQIDILVNNAGIVGENYLFEMTPMSEIKKVFETNFFAQIHMTQQTVRIMRKQRSGSIVNIVSVAALDGNPGQMEYSASKGALVAETKKVAIEFGYYGVRVNAVAPGVTDTRMIEAMSQELKEYELNRTILRRLVVPEEIAAAVAFLSSDKASGITGQILRVDCGRR